MERRGGGGRRNFRNDDGEKRSTNAGGVNRPGRTSMSADLKDCFESFRREIDDRNDKWERIVKCSRDITIESKRVIFLLHRVTQNDQNVLTEADERLATLRQTKFRYVADELRNEDYNYFHGAYRPGLEEYLEAASFVHYLRTGELLDFVGAKKSLTFKDDQEEIRVNVQLADYLCGVGDFTGELMRLAINYVSGGNFQRPVEICQFLNRIYRGFVLLGHTVGSKDFNFKLRVAKQNLEKVENACYVLKLRRSEVPEHLLADVMTNLFAAPMSESSYVGQSSDVDYVDV